MLLTKKNLHRLEPNLNFVFPIISSPSVSRQCRLQSNIETNGFRSLQEGEEVEFDLVIGDDEKKKAYRVTGPARAPPLVSFKKEKINISPATFFTHKFFLLNFSQQGSMMDPSRMAFSVGRGMAMPPFDASSYPPGAPPFVRTPPAFGHLHHQQQQQQQNQQQQGSPLGSSGHGGTGSTGQGPMAQPVFYPPMPSPEAAAYMGYFAMAGPAPGGGGGGGGYPGGPPAGPGAYPGGPMFGRGRGQYFPGGRNWAGARPPPPGQPGFSSGLQVVVHNLPWDCTWQQLRDAFQEIGEIERADVVFDSRGRSRGFGIVRFPDRESAELAAEKMNNGTIGGRVVSVRLDRFA
jgi:hypothetical protein